MSVSDLHRDAPCGSGAVAYEAPRIARRTPVDCALIGLLKLSDPGLPSAAFARGED